MNKNILIISYTFPPYPGVGGRRWAKFAKYLTKLGYTVHVICSENPFNKESEWLKDIPSSLKIYKLPVKYPKSLILFPTNIIGKIRYRFDKYLVKIFGNGNYYDRTIFWENNLITLAQKIIKQYNISNVIATGAPFHILGHSIKLKDIFPQINLMIDFRDYWVNDTSISVHSHLSENRKRFEEKLEKMVVEKADIVFTVADVMTHYFKEKYNKEACYTLINGFDEDDFEIIKNTYKEVDDTIKFVYTGSLYNQIDYVFVPLCDALLKLKNENFEIYQSLNFNFYGNQPIKYKNMVRDKKIDVIKFHPQVSLKDALLKIFNSDYCMLFLNQNYNFSLSTKFCEYIALNKKIAVFSDKGNATEFIVSKKMGFWLNPDTIYNDLLYVIKNKNSEMENISEIRESFSIKSITNQLEKHFI